MKILYITPGDHVDYQNDCLLIGLKEMFGADVVDINKQEHIYTSYPTEKAAKLYGRGFSVTRILPDLEVDRTDIPSKINKKFFDLIVYGSIWRKSDDINTLSVNYPKNKIIVVDGEDETNIHSAYALGIPYFKRELIHDNKHNLFPVQFALPGSKINTSKLKTKLLAHITPLDKTTYIYNTEEEYYNDYRDSYFAITCKKAGWDCMRHWEILGNGCIPIFIDLKNCPKNTMTRFPYLGCNDLLDKLQINNFNDKSHISEQILKLNSNDIYHFLEVIAPLAQSYFSTQALAKEFISTCSKL